MSYLLALVVASTYVVYLIGSSIFSSRRLRLKAKQLKCQPPPQFKNKLPLGVDQISRSLKALASKQFPTDTKQKFDEINALTFTSTILGRELMATADEHNIQALLATQFQDFDLGAERIDNFMPFLGSGIFAQDGKNWARSRALMKPQFARDNLSDLVMEERHIQALLNVLPDKGNDGWSGMVDLQPLFFKFTLDTATEFLLGQSVHSQSISMHREIGDNTSETDVEAFAREFDNGTMALAKRSRFTPYSWMVWPKGFRKSISTCHRMIDRIVNEHLHRLESGKDEKSDRYVFLEHLAAETRDPIELRAQLMNILLAGRDTTSSLLGFTFLLLTRDPVRYKKLRDIILGEFGTYSSPENIKFAKIKACKYLLWVLQESMRLYPLVPWNFRVANRDTTLPRGGGPDGKEKIFIKKGTVIEYSVFVLHRRKDIWGEDVLDFRPERWEGKRVGWDFLPVSLLFYTCWAMRLIR